MLTLKYLVSQSTNTVAHSVTAFAYSSDKFLFCNFYRIPPKYSDAIGSRSTTLIGCSILFHIFMSCWILGNNQIFSGESIVNDFPIDIVPQLKLKDLMHKKHIIILEIIAAIFLIHILSKELIQTFGTTLQRTLRCVLCMKGDKVKKLKAVMNTVQVTYSGARARGVIKGLASYNILQNPKYQAAFAISPEFAINHNRLR
jgi:hypothetical protein